MKKWSHNAVKSVLPTNQDGEVELTSGVELGGPKKTLYHSAEELSEKGMVGIYTTRYVDPKVLHII